MNKNNFLIFIFSFLISCLVQAYHPKSGNILGTLGPYWYKTNYPGSQAQNYSPILTGVSLVANGDTSDSGSLEVALIYAPRLYYRQEKGLTQLEKVERMHITMGYRWWLSSLLSTSLALFSSYAIGDPSVVYMNDPAAVSVDTSARDTVEYGLDLAVQFEIVKIDRITLVTEARYSYSLTSKENEKADHYGLSLGFRYLFQGTE